MVPKWHQIGHRGLSWRLLGSSWALPGACWRPSRPKECPKGPQEAPKGIPETMLELIWGHMLKPKAFKHVRFVCTMVPCAKRLNLFGILLAANNCCPRNGSPWRVLGRSPGVKKQCFGCIFWQRFGVQTRAQTTSKRRKRDILPPARLSSILDRFQRRHEGAFPGGRRHLQLGMSLMCNVWHLV